MNARALLLAAVLAGALPARGADGAPSSTSGEVNQANNPLTPMLTANLQDQWVLSYHDLPDADSNAVLLRGVLPHKLFGWPQILRATIPLVTSPDVPAGSTTGLGDINLFDVLLFKAGTLQLGLGPQLTFPTATDARLGTGKWQAGAAAIAIQPTPQGLLGGLVTYQHSVVGDDDRATQSVLQAQPFIIVNLPGALYVRSTATWNFDLEQGTFYIPVGLGLGKVWVTGDGTTINVFAEPQLTVVHDGVAPEWQLFAGINLQFPLSKR